MYEYFGFGTASRRGLTFESLRAPETLETLEALEKAEPEGATRRGCTNGLVLLPPATWTDGPGGEEGSAGVFDRKGVDARNARDATDEREMLEQDETHLLKYSDQT